MGVVLVVNPWEESVEVVEVMLVVVEVILVEESWWESVILAVN